ncbi:MAG: outer membrane protein assembly factor BamB family protein [Thermomicrobiales bacterium]
MTTPACLLGYPLHRRHLLRGTGATLLLGSAFSPGKTLASSRRPSSRRATAGDWPVASGDPARTGFTSSAGPTGNPTMGWCWTPPGPGQVAAPVVADDIIYVTVGVLGGATLLAMAVDDASLLWTHELDFQPFASAPAIADGVIYVCGLAGEIAAIDIQRKETVWQSTLETGTTSSPLVIDDLLYIGDDSDTLSAIDIADGSVRWTFSVGPGATYTLGPSPAYANRVVFFGSATSTGDRDSGLFAIDAKDGTERWKVTAKEPGFFTPAVADGTVYVGGNAGMLHAIDAETGDVQWATRTGAMWTSPAVTGHAVVVQTFDGHLIALDRSNGDPVWDVASPGAWAPPVIAGDTVYVGATGLAFETGLHAFSLDTGEALWRAAIDGVTTPVAITKESLIVAGNGALAAFEGASGSAVERGEDERGAFIGPIAFSIAVDDDKRPIDPAQTFDAGIPTLEASADVVGIPSGSAWRAVWSLDGEELVSREETWPGTSALRLSERISANDGSLASGRYAIEIQVDGTPVRRASATIG